VPLRQVRDTEGGCNAPQNPDGANKSGSWLKTWKEVISDQRIQAVLCPPQLLRSEGTRGAGQPSTSSPGNGGSLAQAYAGSSPRPELTTLPAPHLLLWGWGAWQLHLRSLIGGKQHRNSLRSPFKPLNALTRHALLAPLLLSMYNVQNATRYPNL